MGALRQPAGSPVPWVLSVLLHGAAALVLLMLPARGDMTGRENKLIELTDRKPPPPPEPRPQDEPEEPKEPEDKPKEARQPPKPKPQPKRVAMRRKPPEPAETPPPAEPDKTPPPDQPDEPPPTFGLDLSGTTKAAPGTGVQIPEGDTLQTNPENRGPRTNKNAKPDPRPRKGFKKTYSKGERAPLAVVTSRARVAKRVLPEYSARARDLGIEGRVVVELTIDASGRVVAAKLLQKLYPDLDDAARKAALKMRFTPAEVNGTAVQVKIPYTFTFVLD